MKQRHATSLALALLLAGAMPAAQAFVVNISGGPRMLYLRIGDGVYGGNYIYGNDPPPGTGGPINRVSVTVPAAMLGNGTSLAMTSNATQATSNYDGYAFCNLPSQVYIGGFNRRTGGTGTLSVAVSAPLTNASGNTIPFSQITWTSSGNGDGTAAQPFPAGNFSGLPKTLATFPVNTWRESCHTFSYSNSTVVAAGTYTGRVTYTLSVP